MNPKSVFAAVLVLSAAVFAIKKMIMNKKTGKGGCSCGCESCALRDECHNKKSS